MIDSELPFVGVFEGSRVVVTGHTGFKGSWLSVWLKSMGAEVYGISKDIPTDPSHFETARLVDHITDIRVDVTDRRSLEAKIHEISPDFVFHLAAQPLVKYSYTHPVDTWMTNVMGTVNMLESLRGLQTPCVAVFITSDKCYDNVEWVWGYRETDALGGPDPYSATKGAAELAIKSYVKSYFPADGNVRIGIGRAGNVIGGGDWAADRIVPDCMKAWSRGEVVEIRNPHATRPWQHVLEPLSGYLTLAASLKRSADLHGEPFNFGPSLTDNHSVGDLVDAMTVHWDKVRWKDVSHGYGGPYESGLLKLNCDKALHHLNWRACLGFEDTVAFTVEWYKNQKEGEVPVFEFSNLQIERYIASAQTAGLSWAKATRDPVGITPSLAD